MAGGANIVRLTGPAALAVMAFVVGACDARPPLVVDMDAGADREMRSRIPTCQPGIRETACTSAADAHAPDSTADGGGDGAVLGLDASDGALPDAGAATDARGVDGAVDGAAACQPTSGGSGDFRLVDIQPHQMMTHAAVTFTIKYEGELPSPQAL